MSATLSENEMDQPLVLIADDDPEIRAMVAHRVRNLSNRIIEASDGQEALRIAQSEQPSLVVLDVMMPGMSGWEVCRALREDENMQQTRILMLTGIGERLNEMTSPLYGADAYLDKPFEFDSLDQVLHQLLPSE